MSQWPQPDPRMVDRVRLFVLQGYTGAQRVATLISSERKWPTPSDVRYGIKKPTCRWAATTITRIIESLSWQGEDSRAFPNPAHLSLGAMRRILRFHRKRGSRAGEECLQAWLAEVAQHFALLKNSRKDDLLLQSQKSNLFDPIS